MQNFWDVYSLKYWNKNTRNVNSKLKGYQLGLSCRKNWVNEGSSMESAAVFSQTMIMWSKLIIDKKIVIKSLCLSPLSFW